MFLGQASVKGWSSLGHAQKKSSYPDSDETESTNSGEDEVAGFVKFRFCS
jgi:hypothetical protein